MHKYMYECMCVCLCTEINALVYYPQSDNGRYELRLIRMFTCVCICSLPFLCPSEDGTSVGYFHLRKSFFHFAILPCCCRCFFHYPPLDLMAEWKYSFHPLLLLLFFCVSCGCVRALFVINMHIWLLIYYTLKKTSHMKSLIQWKFRLTIYIYINKYIYIHVYVYKFWFDLNL